MSTSFIDLVQPPGKAAFEALRKITTNSGDDSQSQATGHATFLDALLVRKVVFVDEQKCQLENEVDNDDTRSYHWVVHASISTASNSTPDSPTGDLFSRRKSSGGRLPVGTIRLVPSPHVPHPAPGSVDGKGGEDVSAQRVSQGDVPTHYHNGREAYVKVGRMAIVKEYRGMGLGKLLVNEALQWATKNKDKLEDLPDDPVKREQVFESMYGEWKGLVMAHAQVSAVRFYQSLGFEVDQALGKWVEEGIEHVAMWKRLSLDHGKQDS